MIQSSDQTQEKGRRVVMVHVPIHGLMDLMVAATAGTCVGVRLAKPDSLCAPVKLDPDRLLAADEDQAVVPQDALVANVSADHWRNALTVSLIHDSFALVPDGDIPPIVGAAIHWLPALPAAIAVLARELKDASYRETWRANLAMSAADEGVDHATAQRIADRFLNLLSPPSQQPATEQPVS